MNTLLQREFVTVRKSPAQYLDELRMALLHLHKVLLEIERVSYEKIYGRVSGGELLQLIIQDRQFSWLRPILEIVVQIDELLDVEGPVEGGHVRLLSTRALDLLVPSETSGDFARNYHLALQSDPEVVLAHRAVRRILTTSGRTPASNG